jgi:hypothetical protein
MDKKSRKIFSFEPDGDVLAMLEKAKQAGLTQGEILNEALRDCGPRVIKRIAHKRARSLSELSFPSSNCRSVGNLIAA